MWSFTCRPTATTCRGHEHGSWLARSCIPSDMAKQIYRQGMRRNVVHAGWSIDRRQVHKLMLASRHLINRWCRGGQDAYNFSFHCSLCCHWCSTGRSFFQQQLTKRQPPLDRPDASLQLRNYIWSTLEQRAILSQQHDLRTEQWRRPTVMGHGLLGGWIVQMDCTCHS